MRNATMLGGLAALVTAVAGYGLLIAPQANATDQTRAELSSVQAANKQSSTQLPILKAQLANISSSVDGLRALSQQVPPSIDLPSLYAELDTVAAQAGSGVAVTNVSVSVPALINPDGTTATAAAPASAATATTTTAGSGAGADTKQPAATETAPPAAAVLASYQVNMDVDATPEQTVAFIKALGSMKRLNVVAASGYTASSNGRGTVHVSATFYLQQVDVDGLAAQIEALAKAQSGS